MSDFNYLVGISLVESEGKRAMPLGGKSIKESIAPDNMPGEKAYEIALELLLRVLQKSEEGAIKRTSSDRSLIMAQISLEKMQDKLPLLKSEWLLTGDDEKFFLELKTICSFLWKINYVRYEGIKFSPI